MRKIWCRMAADLKEYRCGVMALLAYGMISRLAFHAFCPMVILTGLPCPGCGLSRAVWYLLTGRFARSFALHPLAPLWLALIIVFAVNRYVAGRGVTKRYMICVGIVAGATLLLYGYRMLFVFPGRPPASYTGRNLMERAVPGYRRKVLSLFGLFR